MTNYRGGLWMALISFILVWAWAFAPSVARAETLQSITFHVPLNVTNINPGIKFVAPMCAVFTGSVTSNANELGAARPDIAVPASRKVSQKVTMTIARANLFAGKSLDNVTSYVCTLYVKKSANGPLLVYSSSSQDPATRAVGTAPINAVQGAIRRGRQAAITINTARLQAAGNYPQPTRRPVVRPPSQRAGKPSATHTDGTRTQPGASSRGNTRPSGIGSSSRQKPQQGNVLPRQHAVTTVTRHGVARSGARLAETGVSRVDTGTPGPEPDVTGWNPQGIAHPGQTLVVEGRDFQPGLTVQLQGENNHAINLRVVEQTDTRAVAQITTSDYTGHDGARLVVFQRGGKPKTLDDNYKIVDPKLTFQGDSLWHIGTNPADNIFTTGTVSLTLNNYEFADQGSGTYRETVPLIGVVRTLKRKCRGGPVNNGERTITMYNFKDESLESPVEWRKLPDGRIQIEGQGINGRFSATGQINDDLFNFQYNTPLFYAARYIETSKCNSLTEKAASFLPGVTPDETAPLRATPERLVEWTLQRTTP